MAEFFDKAVHIALKIKGAIKGEKHSLLYSLVNRKNIFDGVVHSYCCNDDQYNFLLGTTSKDFGEAIEANMNFQHDIRALRHEVEEYAKQFPTIGFEKTSMKYKD
mgnify:FL=1